MFKKPERMDFSKTKCFSVKDRHNLVRIDNMARLDAPYTEFKGKEMDLLVEALLRAKESGAAVTCFFGAHVIKCGLSRYVIAMLENGIIDSVASNGAGSIHDFELAYLGGTSEDVPTAIEDGSFGMWEETGAYMNEAISSGFGKGMGYGESLYAYAKKNKSKFPHLDDCVFFRAFEMGKSATYHITMGTDIIHQHPKADFAALGGSSGIDYAVFTKNLSKIDGGAHLNVGSSVTGPEVFLKALSINRNQGNTLFKITTANFDIVPLGDYKSKVTYDDFEYYYRPRKNVINRPTSQGGLGLYLEGKHEQTIPTLYNRTVVLKK